MMRFFDFIGNMFKIYLKNYNVIGCNIYFVNIFIYNKFYIVNIMIFGLWVLFFNKLLNVNYVINILYICVFFCFYI